MTSWAIGKIKVTRIEEGVGTTSCEASQFLTGFDQQKFDKHLGWVVPSHYETTSRKLTTSIHTWLIQSDRLTILLDTCSGNCKHRPHNPRFHQLNIPYLERLQAAGVKPEDVDVVVCTHLHSDHCGWNTHLKDGHWVPTFPNARYLFSRMEADSLNPALAKKEIPQWRLQTFLDSVLPVIEAGQAVLIDGAHDIDENFRIEPAPGHTPGHIMLRATDGTHRGLFCGDAIHHPVQVFQLDWNTRFCEDPELARTTRRRLMEECADHGALLFPTHFAEPYVVAISRLGDGFVPSFIPGHDEKV